MEKISLIIPCKNEVESLGAVLEEVKENKFVDEIIIVVDSEEDNSIPITKKFNWFRNPSISNFRICSHFYLCNHGRKSGFVHHLKFRNDEGNRADRCPPSYGDQHL